MNDALADPETEIRTKLLVGSEFRNNRMILMEDGWILISGEECPDGDNNGEYVYVREADPTYSLILNYSRKCTLRDIHLRRRYKSEL